MKFYKVELIRSYIFYVIFNFGGLLTCLCGAIPYQVSAVNPDAFPGQNPHPQPYYHPSTLN